MRGRFRNRLAVAIATAALAATAAPIALAAWTGNATAGSAVVGAVNLVAPTGVSSARGTCVAGTSFQINLSWSAAAGARGYLVLRGTASGGPYTQITASPITATTYSDAGPTSAFAWQTTYYYVVEAYAGGWTSANSAQTSILAPKKANCT